MGKSAYRTWKNWESGDFLVGKYVSTSEDNYGKPNYKVEVIEASFSDGSEPKASEVFTFNSSGALIKAMEEVQVGDIIKVIYKGEEVMTKGKYKGKAFHSMEVLVADSKGEQVSKVSDDDELI